MRREPRSALVQDSRGVVYLETLVAFMPVFMFFLGTLQLADLSVAHLVVQHASSTAARAAVVVLPDDGAYYEDHENSTVHQFTGLRRADVELAADLVMQASPRLSLTAVELDQQSYAERQDLTATVKARYRCLISTFCGSGLPLESKTKLVYQGAQFVYEPTTIGEVASVPRVPRRPRDGTPPGEGAPGTPGDGTPGTPGTPGDGTPTTPGDGTPDTSGEGTPTTPGDGTPPRDGTPSTPGDGRPSTPVDGRPSTPGDGRPSTPGDGRPSTPRDGTPSTPGDGRPSTPGDGRPSTPGDGTPATPNPNHGNTPGQQTAGNTPPRGTDPSNGNNPSDGTSRPDNQSGRPSNGTNPSNGTSPITRPDNGASNPTNGSNPNNANNGNSSSGSLPGNHVGPSPSRPNASGSNEQRADNSQGSRGGTGNGVDLTKPSDRANGNNNAGVGPSPRDPTNSDSHATNPGRADPTAVAGDGRSPATGRPGATTPDGDARDPSQDRAGGSSQRGPPGVDLTKPGNGNLGPIATGPSRADGTLGGNTSNNGNHDHPPFVAPNGRPLLPVLNPQCFAAGTLVYTADGDRPIETIQVGDLVWSRDELTGQLALKPVTTLFATPGMAVGELQLRAGTHVETLVTTPNHPFWVQDKGWVAARTLQDPAPLWSPEVRIEGHFDASHSDRADVFNLEVEGFHTYFVGALHAWVHNTCELGRSSGVRWDDPALTREEFIDDYIAANRTTKFSRDQIGGFYDQGDRVHPGTGRLRSANANRPVDLSAHHVAGSQRPLNMSDLSTREQRRIRRILRERDAAYRRWQELQADPNASAQDVNAARYQVIDASRRAGEAAAEIAARSEIERRWPGAQATRVYPPEGQADPSSQSGDFDRVYEVRTPDGEVKYVVIEAKGGSSDLGTRMVNGERVEQGTLPYYQDIVRNMAFNGTTPEMRAAGLKLLLQHPNRGNVVYMHVKLPIDTNPYPSGAYQSVQRPIQISDFDLTPRPSRPRPPPAAPPPAAPPPPTP